MKPEDLDKVKKALGEHADAENSDIDMDDIPDEDMDNLDKKLVEAFKVHILSIENSWISYFIEFLKTSRKLVYVRIKLNSSIFNWFNHEFLYPPRRTIYSIQF